MGRKHEATAVGEPKAWPHSNPSMLANSQIYTSCARAGRRLITEDHPNRTLCNQATAHAVCAENTKGTSKTQRTCLLCCNPTVCGPCKNEGRLGSASAIASIRHPESRSNWSDTQIFTFFK